MHTNANVQFAWNALGCPSLVTLARELGLPISAFRLVNGVPTLAQPSPAPTPSTSSVATGGMTDSQRSLQAQLDSIGARLAADREARARERLAEEAATPRQPTPDELARHRTLMALAGRCGVPVMGVNDEAAQQSDEYQATVGWINRGNRQFANQAR